MHRDEAFEALGFAVDQGDAGPWQDVFDQPFLVDVEGDVVPMDQLELLATPAVDRLAVRL